jgi:hypothetical protein
MSKKFYITEQERLHILKKYNLLKEVTDKGKCIDGNCQNGKGKVKYSDNTTYEGSFVNGLKDGNGVYTYLDGDVYSGGFKNDKFQGSAFYRDTYGSLSGDQTLYSGNWTTKTDSEGIDRPIPDTTDSDFVVGYGEEYTYKGYFSENGMNGQGLFRFVLDNDATYTGTFKQTNLESKIYFKGTDPEGNEIETEDLIAYHTKTPVEEPETVTPDHFKIEYTDQLRKNWKGCLSGEYDYLFNGGGEKDYGYQKDIPELGWAKYEGTLDGKQVRVNGCWDKFKLITGEETGDRGDFKGDYYTTNNKGFFEGDESRANKFMYGTLKNSPDYSFYDQDWSYVGYFANGEIDTTEINSTSAPLTFDAGVVNFGKEVAQIKFSDGNIYAGSFVDGQIDGQGTFVFTSGLKLSGDFQFNENSENMTYSVTLNDSTVIDDIFQYDGEYVQKNQKNISKDESIGILKSGIFKGRTFFNVELSDEKETIEKKGFLPKVFIRITNLDNNKIFFEQTSDDEGYFNFETVPFGKYSLTSNINGNNEFSLEVSSFDLNSKVKDVNLYLKPSKGWQNFIKSDLKRLKSDEGDGYNISVIGTTKLSDFTREDIMEYFIDQVYEIIKPDTWLSDIINGRFEQKYGTITTKEMCTTQLKNYADLIRKIQSGELDTDMTKKVGAKLRPTKKYIQNCWRTYPKDMEKQKSDFLLVRNPGGDIIDYAIVLENANKQDIYNKNSMGLKNTISNVIHGYNELKKRKIQENQIIKNRLNFVINENKVDSLVDLIKEKNILLNNGYDNELVEYNYDKIINKFR